MNLQRRNVINNVILPSIKQLLFIKFQENLSNNGEGKSYLGTKKNYTDGRLFSQFPGLIISIISGLIKYVGKQ